MERWEGKVAVVTGASVGIGKAIALKLAEHGLIVAGLARRSELIEELSQQVKGKGKIHAIKCDLTDQEDNLRAFKWIQDNLGEVHVLINNAGMARPGPFVDTSTDVWRQIFDLNVLAVATFTREFLKQAAEKNVSGHVISISSIAGLRVPPYIQTNAYSPSKFALQALQEVVRQELTQAKSKTKSTIICPGLTESEMAQKTLPPGLQHFPRMQADDVANAVVFALASPPNVQIQQIVMTPTGAI